jgi:hypothetical protein
MTNQELKQQYEMCQLWNDANQWDYLAVEFYRHGYTMNALQCFRRADIIRGCAFAEAMPAEMAEA